MSASEITIRQARKGDDEALIRMGRDFFDTTPLCAFLDYSPDSITRFSRSAIELPNLEIFVAEMDGKVIGSVSGIVFAFYLNDSVTVGQELFWWVDPDARKSRAGNMLHKALQDWAKERGASVFIMGSIANSSSARMAKLYANAGYVPTENTFMKVI